MRCQRVLAHYRNHLISALLCAAVGLQCCSTPSAPAVLPNIQWDSDLEAAQTTVLTRVPRRMRGDEALSVLKTLGFEAGRSPQDSTIRGITPYSGPETELIKRQLHVLVALDPFDRVLCSHVFVIQTGP